ncbi:MAG: hypothetical protein KC503_08465 [Myxococcales bacterium]|nr:hypothetical protein [Myxococcales bacterium]
MPRRHPLSVAAVLILAFAPCACSSASEPLPELPAVSELPRRDELPDALTTFIGARSIDSPDAWRDVRAPELRRLFQHYVYGFWPTTAEVRSEVIKDVTIAGGKVRYKHVRLTHGDGSAPPINVALFLPPAATRAPPVFLALDPCGNHTLIADPEVALSSAWVDGLCPGAVDNKATEAGRGGRAERWPIALIVERGFALAAVHESDIDPDNRDDTSFADGVHPHYQVDVAPAQRWGTIAAWTFGVQRVVDHLVADSDVDGKRIITVGHSRRGKVALLAAAFDERIAMAIPHQSGTGGATLSRSSLGESLFAINGLFPHWFNDTFPLFNNKEVFLPVDQHLLIALVAPRPLLATNGDDDSWADPPGALRAVEAASPVYELLGSSGLQKNGNDVLLEADLSWHSRPGGHSLGLEDWQTFLRFAEHHFGAQ